MTSDDTRIEIEAASAPAPKGTRRSWRRLWRSKDGAAAIEFALLAIPYFLIVFAILETFVAYLGEQLVGNAVDTMARKLRTGNITYNLGRTATDMNVTQFRQAFCTEISILIQCSATEAATPSKLFLDVRTFSTFAAIPTTIPRTSAGDLDTSTFAFTPGGPKTINSVRAYYKWDTVTDLVRPYITNMRPTDGSRPNYFLIVETSAFQNEDYP